MKICSRCKVKKSKASFGKRAARKDGLQPWCKQCAAAYARKKYSKSAKVRVAQIAKATKWNKSNEEKRRQANRLARARKYGLTLLELEQLEKIKACEICGRNNQLSIDHDHTTLKVRGVLCWHCNTGLGKLGDTIQSVGRALTYLQRAG